MHNMTSALFDKMWSFVRENKSAISRCVEASDNVKCVLCRELLIEPKQAPCECRFCAACISEFLCAAGDHNDSCGEKICPGGTRECAEEYLCAENITSDYVTSRKISKMRVRCANEACLFEDALLRMSDHWRDCTRGAGDAMVDCPYGQLGCARTSCDRRQMGDHLQSENYEHCQMMMRTVENLRNEIDIVRRDNEGLILDWTRQQEEIERLNERIDGIICGMRDNKSFYEECLREKIDELRWDIEGDESDEFNKAVFVRKEFLWKIHNYAALKQSSAVIDSDKFFTHPNGYSMQLRLVPPKVYNYGRHGLSFYVNCVHGSHDLSLKWPLIVQTTIGLLQQSTAEYFINDTKLLTYHSSDKSHNSAFFFHFNKEPFTEKDYLSVKCAMVINN